MNGNGNSQILPAQTDMQMDSISHQITEQERTFAIEHLIRTRDTFLKSIKNVDEKTWYRRPGPGQWSVAECAEHLMLTEVYYFMPSIQKMLAEGPDPSRMEQVIGKDAIAISSMEDRSYKAVGAPWEETNDREIDKNMLMETFLVKRNEVIQYLLNTKDPLRAVFFDAPGLGLVDAFQFILYISAHTTRHTGQILDIVNMEFHPNTVAVHG